MDLAWSHTHPVDGPIVQMGGLWGANCETGHGEPVRLVLRDTLRYLGFPRWEGGALAKA